MPTPTPTNEIVDAIRDLTRVVIAVSGQFESRAEAIRQLSEMSIPAARIAAIFDIRTNEVTSVTSRDKRRKIKRNG